MEKLFVIIAYSAACPFIQKYWGLCVRTLDYHHQGITLVESYVVAEKVFAYMSAVTFISTIK
jgi:hypothetical protein